jgi:membrane protein DedA with SNARE-associated domain
LEFLHTIENQYFWPFIDSIYNGFGWVGVVIMMAIESCMIPLPSEIIMPLAGDYLVQDPNNWGGILLAGLFGATGCTIGSIAAYWLGALGGRPLLEKYGKYVLIRMHHLHTAEQWFQKYGEATAFFSRLLPVVRTFVSFPAGVARMNFIKFCIYTFLGSFPWCVVLAWAGAMWSPRDIREALRPYDVPIVAILLALVLYFIVRSWRNRRQTAQTA